MSFREPLPPLCPPTDAKQQAYPAAYRLLETNPPPTNSFDSYNKLNKPPYDADPCIRAACSLFRSKKEALTAIKLPGLKGHSFIAELDIPAGAGVSKCNDKNGHIRMWMYDTFDPISAIKKVEELSA